MIARMRLSPCRPSVVVASLAAGLGDGLPWAGEEARGQAASRNSARSIANQPGELRKVSQSAYIIEPPDELEITVQPPFPDLEPRRPSSCRPTATSTSASPGMCMSPA